MKSKQFACFPGSDLKTMCKSSPNGAYDDYDSCILDCIDQSQAKGYLTNHTAKKQHLWEEALKYARRYDVFKNMPIELKAQILSSLSCKDIQSFAITDRDLSEEFWISLCKEPSRNAKLALTIP